jgi:hypothetical protein
LIRITANFDDDENYEDFIARLSSAGLEEIIDEEFLHGEDYDHHNS